MNNLLLGIMIIILVSGLIVLFVLQIKQSKKNKELKESLSLVSDILDTNNINVREVDDFNLELLEKKICDSSDKVLIEYLLKIYKEATNGKIKNYKRIKDLDPEVVSYGLIRMNTLENTYDISKILAPVITITIFFFSAYISFFQQVLLKGNEFFQYLILIGVSAVVYFSISGLITNNRLKHMTVIYFKNLLEHAKSK